MTSVDEIFKKSGIPPKRKLDLVRDPNEIYKSAKYSGSSDPTRRHARVEDDNEDKDMEAGPSLPPPDGDDNPDAEAGPEPPPDDEEAGGRFFGGGITDDQARAFDYVETQEQSHTQSKSDLLISPDTKLDVPWLRRTSLSFEKKINKNATLRAKYPSQPEKFIESEADLDQAVRDLAALSEAPSLYPEFVRLGSLGSLVSLLAHENSDLAIAALQTLAELTDEDVGAGEDEWKVLVLEGLLGDAAGEDLLGLVGSNLSRLDQGDDERDKEGIYHALGLLENICSAGTETKEKIVSNKEILRWLLARTCRQDKKEEEGGGGDVGMDQNRQYAAELLAILCSNNALRNCERLSKMDAVDKFLQLAAPYRKHDPPKGGEEEEFVGDVFETLTALVDTDVGKRKFVEAEGVELVLLILGSGSGGGKDGKHGKHGKKEKEKNKMVKRLSMRLLAHAVSPSTSTSSPSPKKKKKTKEEDQKNHHRHDSSAAPREVSTKLIEEGGLKPLFALFIRRSDPQTLEQLLDIFTSLLRLLPADSAERIRLLAKFVEKDYQKTSRLIALRREYVSRLRLVEDEMSREEAQNDDDDDDDEDRALRELEDLSRRLEAGLYALQLVDCILAWLVAEDDGARMKIVQLLGERDEGLADVKKTLVQQVDGLDEDEQDEAARELREVLGTLVGFLV